MSENNSIVVSADVNEIIDFNDINVRLVVSKDSKESYPEIRKYSETGKINTQSVKIFLNVNGLLSMSDLLNQKCNLEPIAYGLYLAFRKGILSLNATKQKGVLNFTPIRLSTSMGGKMKEVWAISALSLVNPMCLRRMKIKGIVCEHCYVKKSLHISAILNYIQNFFVLTECLLPVEWIPILNEKQYPKTGMAPLVRLESMGDLYNVTQSRNYLTIVRCNPSFRFGGWTKNPNYMAQACDIDGRPENLSLVWSMSRVNVMDNNAERWSKYFDHRFIVVETQELKDSYIAKNGFYPCKCGKRSCVMCRKCYMRTDEITTATELLRK